MTESGPIVLLVSSGWGYRTFLQTDVCRRLEERARVAVWVSPELEHAARERVGERTAVRTLLPFDSAAGRYGQLYRRRRRYFWRLSSTATRRFKDAKQRAELRGRWRRLARYALQQAEARLRASRRSYLDLIEQEHRAFLADAPAAEGYERMLQEDRPALVVTTVAHMPLEAPPVIAARRLGVPTAAWINSWDNLTSKAPYFSPYDHYFLWSDRMRAELARYYPEAAGRPVVATGVPHFDWLVDRDRHWRRSEWCARVGLEPARPVLLYGSATPHLAPSEHLVAEHLARAIEEGRFTARPQLLIRLHPGDDGSRFRALAKSADVRLQMPGERLGGETTTFLPSDADSELYVNTLVHSDVVVNLASTLTLEAAICDRPIVNVAYDASPDRSHQHAIDRYYDSFDHYRTIVEHEAVRLARGEEELIAHVDAYLDRPELEREQRRRIAELWCSTTDGRASERLAEGLLAAAGRPTGARVPEEVG